MSQRFRRPTTADPLQTDALTAPSRRILTVVPSDTQLLTLLPKALYIGGAGDLSLHTIHDEADVVFRNVPTGAILRVRASHVRATGTTASSFLAHC